MDYLVYNLDDLSKRRPEYVIKLLTVFLTYCGEVILQKEVGMAKKQMEDFCGNCGRKVQPHQAKLSIRVKYGTDTFHETWEGCYESTRESGKVHLAALERNLQMITPII